MIKLIFFKICSFAEIDYFYKGRLETKIFEGSQTFFSPVCHNSLTSGYPIQRKKTSKMESLLC
ncbi:hypothetical protein LEP1GSC199_1246 [Leptospira vanthielii serovar Holland str. Waz Holland = ATCC 700522]|uniref:Uncharacterized protein n=1 Tax=Leptospira vanthielii serovar Holland str. Waz Holland = ATCC 700522 TaxID=1218591 RepID=N1W9Q9_9LEPT|nr:hypothetical protein LEP1GSC199_1246 [Leptospira vanthielii serovar Holland str. Waz Holland = ATCC 700522]